MELYEAIAKRRIVRDFKDEDVPLATVEKYHTARGSKRRRTTTCGTGNL